jgi:Tfp pilus assembly protein PilN
LLLAALIAALALVTVYIFASNTIAERKAKLSSLQGQIAAQQALAAQLGTYSQFAQLAQTRVETVKGIATTRFDWHAALSDLARVMPANASLQSLQGTVAPGTSAGGSASGGSGSAGSLRGDISTPALELTGCTSSQDDVARLMSRLRLIGGVTRVTLGSAQKSQGAQTGVATTSPTGSTGSGCASNQPSFVLVVFFKPRQGSGSAGATSAGSGRSGAAASTGGAR